MHQIVWLTQLVLDHSILIHLLTHPIVPFLQMLAPSANLPILCWGPINDHWCRNSGILCIWVAHTFQLLDRIRQRRWSLHDFGSSNSFHRLQRRPDLDKWIVKWQAHGCQEVVLRDLCRSHLLNTAPHPKRLDPSRLRSWIKCQQYCKLPLTEPHQT